ncbi:hypothetical protein BU17DRAFT_64354 [Hysterangium stoloniferum]|nr:hypothetical protein BU17DRAFT_64354 [Hysterangium stoloniferum]
MYVSLHSGPPFCRDVHTVPFIGIFKEKNKKGEHEFVVAAVSLLGPESHQSFVFLVVERALHPASVIDIHRTLSSPDHHVEARDTIFALEYSNFDAFLQQRSAQLLQYVSFNTALVGCHFFALDGLRIVASISEYKESYTLPGPPATGLWERSKKVGADYAGDMYWFCLVYKLEFSAASWMQWHLPMTVPIGNSHIHPQLTDSMASGL